MAGEIGAEMVMADLPNLGRACTPRVRNDPAWRDGLSGMTGSGAKARRAWSELAPSMGELPGRGPMT